MFVEFCVVISPVPFILGSLMGGRIGTLGVGTAKLCTLSDDWDLKKNICQQHPDWRRLLEGKGVHSSNTPFIVGATESEFEFIGTKPTSFPLTKLFKELMTLKDMDPFSWLGSFFPCLSFSCINSWETVEPIPISYSHSGWDNASDSWTLLTNTP